VSGGPGQCGADALHRARPKIVPLAVFTGVAAVFTFAVVSWDLLQSDGGAWKVFALLALCCTTLIGSLLIGRRRAVVLRATSDYTSPRSPAWLGPTLAILPGFVLIGSQFVGDTTRTVLVTLVAYFFTFTTGLTIGLILPVGQRDK
jgi:hypothetical protein